MNSETLGISRHFMTTCGHVVAKGVTGSRQSAPPLRGAGIPYPECRRVIIPTLAWSGIGIHWESS
jgi:hypothetical protein